MSYEHWLFLIVVLAFSIIQFIEVSSFLARLAGAVTENKALAYALQNAVFMATRFFSMLLLPVLGLIIDFHVAKASYLLMVSAALLLGFFTSLMAIGARGQLVGVFVWVIDGVRSGGNLLVLLAKAPLIIWSRRAVIVPLPGLRELLRERIFYYAAIVFTIYGLSIFIAFFFGLVFPDYRTSISQLSAVTNAFATILLTFYVEPRISMAIDAGTDVKEKILALVLGRMFGIGLLSQLFLLPLWSFR